MTPELLQVFRMSRPRSAARVSRCSENSSRFPLLRAKNGRRTHSQRSVARQDGYEAQMERLRSIKLVRSLQELQDSAHHFQKLTGPYAEVASYNKATSDPGEYRRGENKAITDWYWEQKPRVDLAERLTAYASLPQTIA